MEHICNLTEALDIFSDHLSDIRKACVENVQALQSIPHKRLKEDDEPTVEAIRLHVALLTIERDAAPLVRVINRIDSLRRRPSKGGITDADIQTAKEVPIEEMYEGQLFGRKRKFGLCPFHNERSPSFYIFPDNRFHCFGCAVHGTSIDFVMLRDKVPFLQAVKTLIRR
jgi:hypothetical protein